MSAPVKMSKFMNKIEDTLKSREYSDSTIKAYMSRLRLLNLGKPFNSLAFLRKIPAIDDIIAKGKENTQKNYYVTITSVLRDFKHQNTYRKTYDYYMRKLETVAASLNTQLETNEKTETQEENWIQWSEVMKIREELQEKTDKIVITKDLNKKDYNTVLSNLILALYTEIEPRRNKDYMEMKVTNAQYADKLTPEHNYYDTINKRFIYNVYKTAKKYEQQIIDIKDNTKLLKALDQYLQARKVEIPTGDYFYSLLSHYNEEIFNKDYDITRNLNKTFGKNIGASMLRHIYHSRDAETVQKVRDLKDSATNMGHSVGMAINYMKV
jgi:hypothetical protein